MAAATVGRTVGIPLLPPAPAGGGGDDGGDDGDDDGGDDGGDAAATVAAMPAAGLWLKEITQIRGFAEIDSPQGF
jgi:hypothetical protein